MRAVLGVGSLALWMMCAGAHGDDAGTRLEREARRLLQEHVRTWVDETAGYNRRHAVCAESAAAAVAAYDAAHRTTFERMLGWRWDGASAGWLPASRPQAQIRLTFKGPVRSGTVTIGGHRQSSCRAEAPNELVVWWSKVYDAGGSRYSYLSRVPLPALAPSLTDGGGVPAPKGILAPTPRARIEARVDKAKFWLEEKTKTADADLAVVRQAAVCPEAKGRETEIHDRALLGGGANTSWARFDAARTAWVGADENDREVMLVLRWPERSGALHEGARTTWVCRFPGWPLTIEASAFWQDEGENTLTFTVERPRQPAAQ